MGAFVKRRFQLVDVFHDQPLSGNPLAVVLDAQGLPADEMQRIAQWLNLSETAFLLPPTDEKADYRVRIFTLEREMPFAGHPTLGSCHAWLACGGKPRSDVEIVQECGAGLVPIRRGEAHLAFAAPPLIRSGRVDEAKVREIAEFLGIDRSRIVEAHWADNGPGWAGLSQFWTRQRPSWRSILPRCTPPASISVSSALIRRTARPRSSCGRFSATTTAAWSKTP